MRLVLVEWLDAVTDLGWSDDKTAPDTRCLSVGWLWAETRNEICLVATKGDEADGETNNRIWLPKGMIRKVTDLAPK